VSSCSGSVSKKLQGSTLRGYLAAIRLLYEVTLQRPEAVVGIPWPRDGKRKLPVPLAPALVNRGCEGH
jgi:hypothetical protein